MLKLDSVHVSYGAIKAIRGVSIEVNPGEVVAVIGANGAGKSTLLKAIVGLEPVSGGNVAIAGRDATRLPSHRRLGLGVALSPEGRQVFPDQTVRDNLLLGAYSLNTPQAEVTKTIERYYDLFPRLRERQSQLAGTLSGGEQQMLAIARALMSSPKLLLLDEPSLGLAPKIIQEIFRIIEDLRAEGLTILLVEQMAKQALSIADRAYVLETGLIIMSGTGSDLLGNPEVRAAYLGSH